MRVLTRSIAGSVAGVFSEIRRLEGDFHPRREPTSAMRVECLAGAVLILLPRHPIAPSAVTRHPCHPMTPTLVAGGALGTLWYNLRS